MINPLNFNSLLRPQLLRFLNEQNCLPPQTSQHFISSQLQVAGVIDQRSPVANSWIYSHICWWKRFKTVQFKLYSQGISEASPGTLLKKCRISCPLRNCWVRIWNINKISRWFVGTLKLQKDWLKMHGKCSPHESFFNSTWVHLCRHPYSHSVYVFRMKFYLSISWSFFKGFSLLRTVFLNFLLFLPQQNFSFVFCSLY